MSTYYLEHANVHHLQKQFDFCEEEAHSLLASGLAIPAYVQKPSMYSPLCTVQYFSFFKANICSKHARYDQLLKTSHAFNILDSRGFVGVTERARYFGRMRR